MCKFKIGDQVSLKRSGDIGEVRKFRPRDYENVLVEFKNENYASSLGYFAEEVLELVRGPVITLGYSTYSIDALQKRLDAIKQEWEELHDDS